MKLPIVERMRTTSTGKLMALTPHFSIIHQVEMPSRPDSRDRAVEFVTECRFGVNQWSRDAEAIPILHEQATRVVMREIYGPVEERLFEILTLLFEAGPIYEDKVLQAVESLLKDMRP